MKKRGALAGILILLSLILIFVAVVYIASGFFEGKAILHGGGAVAVIDIKGVLLDSRDIIEDLEKYKENNGVKAIVLRIESPGGGVSPAQEIYDEVRKVREEKVVVASMGSIAASGGYYIACAAQKIVASPGTLTGSIGVVMEVGNYMGLLDKLGLKHTVIKSGKYKDILSPTREVTEEERRLVQDLIDDVYGQFVNAIAEGRGMAKEEVEAIADGRILSGKQALEAKLVDSLGGLGFAIEEAARLAGIEGKPRVIREKERKFGILDLLSEEAASKIPAIYGLMEKGLAPWPGLFFLANPGVVH